MQEGKIVVKLCKFRKDKKRSKKTRACLSQNVCASWLAGCPYVYFFVTIALSILGWFGLCFQVARDREF